jgi:hypothetical protein
VRDVAENTTLSANEYNRAFVLMQYFGYLRRNPDDAPDGNHTGYDFWLGMLNSFTQAGDDVLARVQKADMVKAFIVSGEYRGRFGTPTNPPDQRSSVAGVQSGSVWKQYLGRAVWTWLTAGLGEANRAALVVCK